MSDDRPSGKVTYCSACTKCGFTGKSLLSYQAAQLAVLDHVIGLHSGCIDFYDLVEKFSSGACTAKDVEIGVQFLSILGKKNLSSFF